MKFNLNDRVVFQMLSEHKGTIVKTSNYDRYSVRWDYSNEIQPHVPGFMLRLDTCPNSILKEVL